MGFINNNRFGVSSSGDVSKFTKDIVIANWVLSGSEYSTQFAHNLGTDNLIVNIYKDGVSMSMNNVEIVNANTIKIYNDTAMNCKVVILAKI